MPPVVRMPKAMTIGSKTILMKRFANCDALAVVCMEREFIEVHEAVHRNQYREYGVFPFLASYVFRPSLRVDWEAAAYGAALCTVGSELPPSMKNHLWSEAVLALVSYRSMSLIESYELLAQYVLEETACETEDLPDKTRMGQVLLVLSPSEKLPGYFFPDSVAGPRIQR